MQKGYEAIVCGGGAAGAAVAYYLAESGLRPLLVEAQALAHGASGFAAGILSPPLTDDLMGPAGPLQKLSFELHRELAEHLPAASQTDYEYSVIPLVNIAATEEAEQLYRVAAERLTAAGLPFRWVADAELERLCPWIDVPVRGGLYEPHAAQVDPAMLTRALATAVESKDGAIRSGRVTGLVEKGGRVTGVLVNGEPVEAGVVVLAMGPWTGEAEDWLGLRVPVEPLKGQILRLRMREPAHWSGFSTVEGNYLLPKQSGLVYVGTTEERSEFDRSTTEAARTAILQSHGRFCTKVLKAEVVEQTACLRPVTPDGLPLLGPIPGLDGAYIATGYGRAGILLCTGAGKSLAELIASGSCESLDLRPFALDRFGTSARRRDRKRTDA